MPYSNTSYHGMYGSELENMNRIAEATILHYRALDNEKRSSKLQKSFPALTKIIYSTELCPSLNLPLKIRPPLAKRSLIMLLDQKKILVWLNIKSTITKGIACRRKGSIKMRKSSD